MYNLFSGRLDQARFFFDTTLKQCGPVLPGLLGMASVLFQEGHYKQAQDYYTKAIRLYPESGAPTRVGFAMACYKLGQMDRAKAALARALQLNPEYVPAMVGAAILDMGSLDITQKDFAAQRERAMKQMSMANLLDHSNAMVQNHLANHYFWKWTPVVGTVSVEKGSKIVKGSQPIPLDSGERVRIGIDMETTVEEEGEENNTFIMRDDWKGESQCKSLGVNIALFHHTFMNIISPLLIQQLVSRYGKKTMIVLWHWPRERTIRRRCKKFKRNRYSC